LTRRQRPPDRTKLLIAALAALAAVLAGCASAGSGIQPGERVDVYVSMPLRGPEAATGRDVVDAARLALADAGGKAGGHPIELKVLDDTGGGPKWDPVATGANARQANENAATIGYLGDLDPGATRTSLPITDEADIPQIVLGEVPGGLDVKNLADPRVAGEKDPGGAAMALLLAAIERAGSDGGDRKAVLDELNRTLGG
jgi:ABC-type branched-subunit amino acid transport system substrate-binding protein